MAKLTASQEKVIKSGAYIFEAIKAANPSFTYSSGLFCDLVCKDGTTVERVRMDCSGAMAGIIRHMGYKLDSEGTGAWCGLTSNTMIKNSDDSYSEDWVIKAFDAKDRQPGDILVTSGHSDMYVFTNSLGYRGFNAGSGDTGDSIGPGLRQSYNLGAYYLQKGTWEGSGTDVGAGTIGDSSAVTVFRYVGPGGSSSTVQSFYTDKPIYDVSKWNRGSHDNVFKSDKTGGLIIQIGSLHDGATDIASDQRSALEFWVKTYAGKIPLGFYFYSYINCGSGESETKATMKCLIDNLTSLNITPELAPLGLWIDMEERDILTSDKSTNFNQIRWFREVCIAAGYTFCGMYTGPGYVAGAFNVSDCKDIPLWYAFWPKGAYSHAEAKDFSASFDATCGDTQAELKNSIYIWQDGGTTEFGGLCDHDWQIKAIEGSGTVVASGTIEDSYELVAAKKIIWDPEPGLVDVETRVRVTTDAEGATVYLTANNAVPEYGKTGYDMTNSRFVITRNHHLRAYAFDSEGKIVAKGAATYTIPWVPPKPEPISSIRTAILEHQKSSLRPYLMYHTPELEKDEADEITEAPITFIQGSEE